MYFRCLKRSVAFDWKRFSVILQLREFKGKFLIMYVADFDLFCPVRVLSPKPSENRIDGKISPYMDSRQKSYSSDYL